MKDLSQTLIDAANLVAREGGSPDTIIMSCENFIKIGMDLGFTREHMERVLEQMENENESTKT